MSEAVHVSPDVLSAHLQGEAVLLDLASHRYFRLNETAAHAWRFLERGGHPAGIAGELVQHFDVPPEAAASASARIVQSLRRQGLLREEGRPA